METSLETHNDPKLIVASDESPPHDNQAVPLPILPLNPPDSDIPTTVIRHEVDGLPVMVVVNEHPPASKNKIIQMPQP